MSWACHNLLTNYNYVTHVPQDPIRPGHVNHVNHVLQDGRVVRTNPVGELAAA
jgi:hypothetical protein